MPDLKTGATREGSPKRILRGAWFSNCTGFPVLCSAALINLILFSVFLTCVTPVYETNDDLTMQLIASGFYTGHPDAHLVFTNILIGLPLRFLYTTWPGCNWYLIYILAVHYAAFTAILFVVMSRWFNWRSTLLYVGFVLLVEPHNLLHLQFTTTAFLAGTAGLLLVVDGMQPGQPLQWTRTILGVALMGVMGMIREPVTLLAAAVATPFLVERFGLAGWRRLSAAAVACAGLLFLLHGIDQWAYQRDPAWAEFSEYNHLRGEIHDTPLARHIPQAAPEVEWSKNDGWMFSKFYFSDPAVYAGVSKMRILLAKLNTLAHDDPNSSGSFQARSLFLPSLFGHDAGILMKLALLNAIACLYIAGRLRRRLLATLLISYALCAALGLYLLETARLPERVSYNIPLFVNVICLFWASGVWKRRTDENESEQSKVLAATRRRTRSFRLAGVVVLLAWTALYLSSLSRLAQNLWFADVENQKLKEISRYILDPIRSLTPGGTEPILIETPSDSVLDHCLFFYPATEKLPFSLVPCGWLTHSPIYRQVLDQRHLQPYSISLVSRPNIFFLMKNRWQWLLPLQTFYREHYRLNVRFDLVVNTDEMPQFRDCRLYLYQAHIIGDAAPSQAAP